MNSASTMAVAPHTRTPSIVRRTRACPLLQAHGIRMCEPLDGDFNQAIDFGCGKSEVGPSSDDADHRAEQVTADRDRQRRQMSEDLNV